ncbi:MAG TPA: hypothetical protein VIG57_20470 [Candidatus Entotheonella sp.]
MIAQFHREAAGVWHNEDGDTGVDDPEFSDEILSAVSESLSTL